MSNELDRRLNETAQGLRDVDSELLWLKSLSANERMRVLQRLSMLVWQSHPRDGEVEAAVITSGLKGTTTPVVLALSGPIEHHLDQIIALRGVDQDRSYRLLVTVLGVADNRRRSQCSANCNHWWHHLV